MKSSGWRIALITTVPPVAAALVPVLRQLGHDPVAIVSARRRQPAPPGRAPMGDETAPEGLDVLLAHDKWAVEPLLRSSRPDLALCWGFPWRIPQAALDVPPLGSVNCHPALLPRHRGPIPMAWAFRDGDGQFGVTWHRMDANLDTGAILAQAPVPMLDDDFNIEVVGPRLGGIAIGLLPTVLARLAAGDPGDPQPSEGVTWAGHFGDDYATVDWSQPARRIHDQVRAWAFTFELSPVVGPVAELDGNRIRLVRTSLTDPGGDAQRVEAGDGPLWVVEAEPLG
ncbi:MAG: methionyl-tRNA formyltransferase [Chloroflexota bacterium]|nr:methionyl-tRNA formyltransferase [Chloroflexota bacterium]